MSMNKEGSTLPKNMILNWSYSTDICTYHSLDKLGKWLEQNANGKYKTVNTDIHTQSI